MSGICGLWAFDGGEADLDPVLAQLERRGPDGTRQWVDGPVALGHTLLATTPEALVEQLPLTDAASGCTITADVRLDNRDELIAALGLGGETRSIGDGELILRAYLEWGEECPKQLLGDFAFAIWDPRADKLFCARDHMGMRQLIYHHLPGRLFAFSTEPEALVGHPQIPKRINEGRIADFLDDLEGIDFTSTFFEAVFRLPPAHVMIVKTDGPTLRRYWELTPRAAFEPASDQAFADGFLEVFAEAVRCRLRSVRPIGVMLSGGVDSGAVVAVASRLLAETNRGPLRTLSAVGPDPGSCIETRAIVASQAMAGLATTSINYAELEAYQDDLVSMIKAVAEPFDGNMTLVRAVYLAGHRSGVNVVLDGAGGDVALTASNRIADHLQHRRWRAAWREALGEQLFWKVPRHRIYALLSAGWVAFAPRQLRDRRRAMIWSTRPRTSKTSGAIRSEYSREIDRRARWRQFHSNIHTADLSDSWRRAHSIRHPHLTAGRERYDRIAAALAIEPRDPFLDIRVLQYCLSLPAEQLQFDGWPKMVLRRAMAGHLPDAVIWRRGKEHLGWKFTQSLFGGWKDWRTELESAAPALSRYVYLMTRGRPDNHATGYLSERRSFDLCYLSHWMKRNCLSDSYVDSKAANGLGNGLPDEPIG